LSSAYFPESNGRAEIAVKTMKSILTSNVSPTGSLDTESVAKALLLHRNTPAPDMGVSPAELLFGRNIADHLPHPIHTKRMVRARRCTRKDTHARRFNNYASKERRNNLPALQVGDSVAVQNQTGNHSRWDKTGLVVEALPHRQYRILINGSRRLTLRNSRFIRKIFDECVKNTMDEIPDVRPTLTKEDDYRCNNKQSFEQQNAQVPQHPPRQESVEEGPTTTTVKPTAPPQPTENCHQSLKILFYFELGFIYI